MDRANLSLRTVGAIFLIREKATHTFTPGQMVQLVCAAPYEKKLLGEVARVKHHAAAGRLVSVQFVSGERRGRSDVFYAHQLAPVDDAEVALRILAGSL